MRLLVPPHPAGVAASYRTGAPLASGNPTAPSGVSRDGGEIGTVMFDRHPDGSESAAPMDLVRLAIPRRTYTQSHIDYVIEIVRHVATLAPELRGLRIVEQPPQLRHFTARFEPLCDDGLEGGSGSTIEWPVRARRASGFARTRLRPATVPARQNRERQSVARRDVRDRRAASAGRARRHRPRTPAASARGDHRTPGRSAGGSR